MKLRIQIEKKLVLQSFLTFFTLCLLQLTTWIPLRFWGAWGGGNFLDTWQILRYGKCYESIGILVYQNSGTNCSNYLYGRTLLQVLNFFKIDISYTQFFGYTFLFLLAISLTMIFPVVNQRDFIIYILVLLSPPVMLLADRGNFDILIFFILIQVAKSLTRENFLLGYLLLSITTLLKYYTAPVFLLLIFYSKLTRHRILGVVLLLICSGLAFRDISITDADFPHGASAQFGFTVWGEYLNKFSSTQVNNIQIFSIATAIFISILIFTFLSTKNFPRPKMELKQSSDFKVFTFWIFLTVSVSCYFGGMNFDYRLIYFASTILLLTKIFYHKFSQILVNLLVIILWLSFPSGGLQPIGDLVLEIAVSYTIIWLGTEAVKKIKHLVTKN